MAETWYGRIQKLATPQPPKSSPTHEPPVSVAKNEPALYGSMMENHTPFFAECVQRLGLPLDAVSMLDTIHLPIAQWIAATVPHHSLPLMVGVNGAQGSGKSTFCALLAPLLERVHGLTVATVSIDDVYMTRASRMELAETIHPLCAFRGVPGTHDLNLAHAVFDELAATHSGSTASIPRFDKAIDDRLPEAQWEPCSGPIDVVLFEGWCVGCPKLPPWEEPYNARERRDDPDGVWARWSASWLNDAYQKLFSRLDSMIMIEVPSMDTVRSSRWLQEKRLWQQHHTTDTPKNAQPAGLMTEEEVIDYVALFERHTEHMLSELPPVADVLLKRDSDFRYTLARVGRTNASHGK